MRDTSRMIDPGMVDPNRHRVRSLTTRQEDAPQNYQSVPIDEEERIASFWNRLVAMFWDVFAGVLIWSLIAFILMTRTNLDWEALLPMTSVFIPAYWVAIAILVAVRGQSPGKVLVGIKVERTFGMEIGFARALLRELIGKLISLLPLVVPLGFIWVWFDEKNQGWHDKLADTAVVRVSR